MPTIPLLAPTRSQTYVPEFNSLIAFRIPRWHQVTPVADGAPPRYSVRGVTGGLG